VYGWCLTVFDSSDVCKRKGLVGPGGRLKPGVVLPKVILYNKKWSLRRPSGLPDEMIKLGTEQMNSGKWKIDAATPIVESEVEEQSAATAAADAEEERVLAQPQPTLEEDEDDEGDEEDGAETDEPTSKK